MVTSRVEVPATSWDYEKGEISKIATIPKKNIVFCLYIKEKHYFCRVIKKTENTSMKSFTYAYYFFFYFYFSQKVEREFVCIK